MSKKSKKAKKNVPKGVVGQYIQQHRAFTIFVSLSFYMFLSTCSTLRSCYTVVYTEKGVPSQFFLTKKYFGSMNVFKILKVVHYELCI